MKTNLLKLSTAIQGLLVAASFSLAVSSSAVVIPPEPLSIQETTKPMIMLGFGRDHRMFYEAYNDASDIDGDGTIDIRFKPKIIYLGLFNSDYCYDHDQDGSAGATAGTMTDNFFPVSETTDALKKCPGKWSGNWLNYVTTSRIDALKVVLFGGTRQRDTNSITMLMRSYIPQDAHSWAKEYTSNAVDGYLISDYTPLAQPNANRRHFFGNVTANASTNCGTLSNCSDLPPWLSVVTNTPNRVWNWASTERPVLNGNSGGTRKDFTVRVEVCTSSFNRGCKLYPDGNYKPTGLLHDFGENEAALFGLLTGSYDSHLSGGRLRKVMSSFKNEINASSNGTFIPSVEGIVKNFNSFRIYGFNRNNTNQIYDGGVVGSRPVNQGEFPDWGNPVGELMYEAMRYFANKGVATSAFTGSTTIDDIMGLSKPSWDRPYKGQGTSTAEAPYCARASLLTISDTNISFDSNQLPGVNSNFGSGISTDLNGKHINTGVSSSLNVSTVADFITSNEAGITGAKFIGQSGATSDSSPSVKTVASLSSIRGLAPEEPTKQGSYYSASSAHYAKVNDLNSGLTGNQTVDSFVVALASPLPRIEAKLPNGKVISLLPFAKSVSGAFGISGAKTAYQPTNQIVDFYVESIANSGLSDINTSTNGGRYEAKFRINYEDVEQGNDHDMDAIVEYTVRANANNTLDVILQPIYQAGGVRHRMGYVISGSTEDGIYLVVQDENENPSASYFLNVPPGRKPGYCDEATPKADCFRLPYLGGSTTVEAAPSLANATSSISRFTFTPVPTLPNTSSANTAATNFLKDPLWYAAKWGGFTDINNNGRPDIQAEWDLDGDGQPDNYFFVQNPTKLRDSLTKAFRSIVERTGSSSNLASNASGSLDTDTRVFRASYIAGKWTGNVVSLPVSLAGVAPAPDWDAQSSLPAWNARNIFMHTSANTVVNLTSTPFSTLPTPDTLSLSSDDIYKYIRGDQSKEVSNPGTFRKRESILGDIVHSAPAYDLESGTLYVGSNGGMLHAFNGKTGTETFAFIPQQVVPRLKNLASVGYATAHEYFVDGYTLLGYKFAETDNNYYLYSLLGRGGKGLFSIKPGFNNTSPSLLWEYTPLGSTDAAADPDLGLMLSRPVLALLNNGKMGLLVGNGYNSSSGKAVLYIFILRPDGSLESVRKIDTGVAGDNGMAGPAFFDVNADGKADSVYAGDLKGNLWKFDISDNSPANWKLAYASLQPMFKATDSSGNPQPITSSVYAKYNDIDGDSNPEFAHVFFGTGSYFKVGDTTDLSVQSWYGIRDDQVAFAGTSTPVTTTGVIRSALVERFLSNEISGLRYANGAVTGDITDKRGWYIDFKNPANGERMNVRNTILEGTKVLLAPSFYPITNDICTPGGDSWLNFISAFSGANLKSPAREKDRPFVLTSPPPFSAAAENANLFPSGTRLNNTVTNVGIATEPINLATADNRAENSWVGVGTLYGSSSTKIANNDYKRYYDGNAVKRQGSSSNPCVGDILSVISGSEGITSESFIGCTSNRIRGRISWREILKD